MRREERTSCNLNARVELGERGSISCRIGNISRSGALVIVPNAEYLPRKFELLDVFAGTVRPATIVWWGSQRAGIRFLDEKPEIKNGFDRNSLPKKVFGHRH